MNCMTDVPFKTVSAGGNNRSRVASHSSDEPLPSMSSPPSLPLPFVPSTVRWDRDTDEIALCMRRPDADADARATTEGHNPPRRVGVCLFMGSTDEKHKGRGE